MKSHRCTDCLKAGAQTAPRPIVWTSPSGRIERCRSHQREAIKREKTLAATARVARVYGIDRDDQSALWAYQGERCGACGRKCSGRRPDTDHDHMLAREHGHPPERACEDCMRGLLCWYCNKYVLGMGYTAEMLRMIADYLEDPPYQRMRREQNCIRMGDEN